MAVTLKKGDRGGFALFHVDCRVRGNDRGAQHDFLDDLMGTLRFATSYLWVC